MQSIKNIKRISGWDIRLSDLSSYKKITYIRSKYEYYNARWERKEAKKYNNPFEKEMRFSLYVRKIYDREKYKYVNRVNIIVGCVM